MKKINVFQFGFSMGMTGVIFYIIGVILSIISHITVVKAMNLLFHGFDFSSLASQHNPISMTDFIGAILIFVFLFSFGSTVTVIYNYLLKEEPPTI